MRAALLCAVFSTGAFAQQFTDAPLEDTGGRVRWGLSASVGAILPIGQLLLQAEARLGYQPSRQFSAYLSGGGSLGVGGSFLIHAGAIAEFSPVDFFYLGGGPVAAWGRLAMFNFGGTGLVSVAEPPAAGFSGVWKPGLSLRFGFATAASRPPTFRRPGFTFGFEGLLLFHTDMTLGWSRQPIFSPPVTTTQSIVTITPMLTLGFDSR
ncbi:MAG: hypothetical protein Q8L48_13620 [Archangium sp.]|nr:hypothetical protein [Archangium sp.]